MRTHRVRCVDVHVYPIVSTFSKAPAMTKIAYPLTLLSVMLACSLLTAPAHARARVFVASYGNDANPCTFGSPCKTFQQAVNVVDTGGEVTAIRQRRLRTD